MPFGSMNPPPDHVQVRIVPDAHTPGGVQHSSYLGAPGADPSGRTTVLNPAISDVALSRRKRLWLLMEDPLSSDLAFMVSVFITGTILLSTAAVIIETLPRFYGEKHQIWFLIELVTIGLFTVEFVLRIVANSQTSKQFWAFLKSPFTIVDVLSIVPFYVEFALSGTHLGEFQKFTTLRLFRLLRLMRAFQFSALLKVSIEAMVLAVERSFEALLVLVLVLVLVVVIFSTMLYSVERGEFDPVKKVWIDVDGLPSKFDSIPSTFWFVLEIITTVGLGDVYPKTVLGRVITFPVMLFGLLIIALPSIVIGRNFADSWSLLRANKIGRRHSGGSSPASPPLHLHPGKDEAGIVHTPIATSAVPHICQVCQGDLLHNPGAAARRTTLTCGPDEIMADLLKEIAKQNVLLDRIVQARKSEL